jgi:hypothetical protein
VKPFTVLQKPLDVLVPQFTIVKRSVCTELNRTSHVSTPCLFGLIPVERVTNLIFDLFLLLFKLPKRLLVILNKEGNTAFPVLSIKEERDVKSGFADRVRVVMARSWLPCAKWCSFLLDSVPKRSPELLTKLVLVR